MMNDQGGRSHFFTSAKGEQCESIGHSGFDRERGRQTARAALHSLGKRQGSVNFQGVSIYIYIYILGIAMGPPIAMPICELVHFYLFYFFSFYSSFFDLIFV